MFNLCHPKPVWPRKAVAEQIVSSKTTAAIDTSRIIVLHDKKMNSTASATEIAKAIDATLETEIK